MPFAEVQPKLHIKTALTSDREIPSHWGRLTIRQGQTPQHPDDVLHIDLPDDTPWSEETVRNIVRFIDTRLAQGVPVLVECEAAVSRSPSAVVAYLMYSDALSVDAALEKLRQTYPPADPSARILDSLASYFRNAKNSPS